MNKETEERVTYVQSDLDIAWCCILVHAFSVASGELCGSQPATRREERERGEIRAFVRVWNFPFWPSGSATVDDVGGGGTTEGVVFVGEKDGLRRIWSPQPLPPPPPSSSKASSSRPDVHTGEPAGARGDRLDYTSLSGGGGIWLIWSFGWQLAQLLHDSQSSGKKGA